MNFNYIIIIGIKCTLVKHLQMLHIKNYATVSSIETYTEYLGII